MPTLQHKKDRTKVKIRKEHMNEIKKLKYSSIPYHIGSKKKAFPPCEVACELTYYRSRQTAIKVESLRKLSFNNSTFQLLPCHKKCTDTVFLLCGSSCGS